MRDFQSFYRLGENTLPVVMVQDENYLSTQILCGCNGGALPYGGWVVGGEGGMRVLSVPCRCLNNVVEIPGSGKK